MAVKHEKICYTVQDLQEILEVSRPTIYALLKRKEFHSVIIGGKHLIPRKSFDTWLNGDEVETENHVSEEKNRGEIDECAKSHHAQNRQDSIKLTSHGFNTTNSGAQQNPTGYQDMQEVFLQNLIKAYMAIDPQKAH